MNDSVDALVQVYSHAYALAQFCAHFALGIANKTKMDDLWHKERGVAQELLLHLSYSGVVKKQIRRGNDCDEFKMEAGIEKHQECFR